ncbi:alpha/beta hydrolase [Hymenobacter monticola]|uniref:Alpha/beta hydrolase n=1 Tax=Hymenobacter monticola TaxID=1705399 RepID=A0ABY4BB71_9BACT|nr:alpha/beta hydrolase [Hymenobacter monticola]UOE36408.1 alpha/beta hydrolase [Hymenobacter monticola]
MKTLLPFLLLFVLHVAKAQEVLPLYDKIPNSKPYRTPERVSVRAGLVSRVSVPTLTKYQPAVPGPQRSAVIICPGGGYTLLSARQEGEAVAMALSKLGVVAFVLKYRLPSDSTMRDKSIGPLQDAQRALQLVRERAAEWHIDPTKVGLMGFSAGGHLAATAATHFNQAVIDNPKRTSLRPDFSVLLYPVISFRDSLTHLGSRDQLLSKNPGASAIRSFSNELLVTPQTPPAFLMQAADDSTVPVANSLVYYQALLKQGVYSELLLYPHGGHGFGLNNPATPDKWLDALKNWLTAGSFL